MELRRWRERFSQQKLAEAQVERRNARKDLERTQEEVSELNKNRRNEIKKGFTVGAALEKARYAQVLLSDAAQKAEKLEQTKKIVAQRRDDLVEKSRERQVLEKLRERRQTDYMSDMEHEDQAVLDDDASRRHHYDSGKNRNRTEKR